MQQKMRHGKQVLTSSIRNDEGCSNSKKNRVRYCTLSRSLNKDQYRSDDFFKFATLLKNNSNSKVNTRFDSMTKNEQI